MSRPPVLLVTTVEWCSRNDGERFGPSSRYMGLEAVTDLCGARVDSARWDAVKLRIAL